MKHLWVYNYEYYYSGNEDNEYCLLTHAQLQANKSLHEASLTSLSLLHRGVVLTLACGVETAGACLDHTLSLVSPLFPPPNLLTQMLVLSV